MILKKTDGYKIAYKRDKVYMLDKAGKLHIFAKDGVIPEIKGVTAKNFEKKCKIDREKESCVFDKIITIDKLKEEGKEYDYIEMLSLLSLRASCYEEYTTTVYVSLFDDGTIHSLSEKSTEEDERHKGDLSDIDEYDERLISEELLEADVEAVCSLNWSIEDRRDHCIFAVDSEGGTHVIQYSIEYDDDAFNIRDKGDSCPDYLEELFSGRYTKFIIYDSNEEPLFLALGKDRKVHVLPESNNSWSWNNKNPENPFMRTYKSNDDEIREAERSIEKLKKNIREIECDEYASKDSKQETIERLKPCIESYQRIIDNYKNGVFSSDTDKLKREEIFNQINFVNTFKIDDFDYDEFDRIGVAVTDTGKIVSFGSWSKDIWEYVPEEYKAK